MHRRRNRLWIAVFIGALLLLGTLATGWNFVLVRDYQRMVALARSFQQPGPDVSITTLVLGLVLGTLGFFLVLGTFVIFFVKLLKEMRQNQRQSEFLATVTHELKTPIAAIELSSSLLRDPGLSDEEREKLWLSHQLEVNRLKGDVESLLQAARWESMPVHVNRETVELENWIRDSMDRWRTLLGPGAELKRTGDALDLPSLLDLRKLNLISDNIFQNARKYAKDSPQVEVHTLQRDGRWKIEFRDNGWGFDPKDARNLMKPFHRSRSFSSHAIPGAGLGLYIAAEASRALDLKLNGFSLGRGQGAVFTLEGKGLHP